MLQRKTFSIIGAGRLGRALIDGMVSSRYKLTSIFIREGTSVKDLEKSFPDIIFNGCPNDRHDLGRFVFITTPDHAISALAEDLADQNINWEDHIVIHCSGSLPSDILMPLAGKGAITASFHPIQTFPESANQDFFRDIYFSIEGNPDLTTELEDLANDLGARTISLSRQQKRVLHIAAVFMSNYTVALGKIADDLVRSSIEGADYRILLPLLGQTYANMESRDLISSLTGPIARGDVDTIQQHLQEMEYDKEAIRIYKLLGNKLLGMISDINSIPKDRAEMMAELLRDYE